MRLSHVLAPQVPNRSRSRGHSYFLSGAVRSLTSENGIIQATVRGSELYTIWIEPAGPSIRASCPYFIDRFDICKHIWAVVLAAEAQSLPLLAPGVAVDDVELEPLFPDDQDDLNDDDAWRPIAPIRTPPWRQPTAPPTRRPPAAPPPWRQLLDAVSAAASPVPTPRPRLASGQLVYVVDAPASIASGVLVLELMTRDRKLNGEWGKPRLARVTPADIRSHPDAGEQQILKRLLGPRPHLDWGGWDGYGTELSRLQLHGALASDLVPLLCATGRCMLRATPETASLQAVRPGFSPPRSATPAPMLATSSTDGSRATASGWRWWIPCSSSPAESRADAILTADNSLIRDLKREDLELLLS